MRNYFKVLKILIRYLLNSKDSELSIVGWIIIYVIVFTISPIVVAYMMWKIRKQKVVFDIEEESEEVYSSVIN